jgi:hypothetical protein
MLDLLTQNILNLNKTEQAQLFRMLSDHANILIKVVPNSPLLIGIVRGVPVDDSPITQAYNAWKHSL